MNSWQGTSLFLLARGVKLRLAPRDVLAVVVRALLVASPTVRVEDESSNVGL